MSRHFPFGLSQAPIRTRNVRHSRRGLGDQHRTATARVRAGDRGADRQRSDWQLFHRMRWKMRCRMWCIADFRLFSGIIQILPPLFLHASRRQPRTCWCGVVSLADTETQRRTGPQASRAGAASIADGPAAGWQVGFPRFVAHSAPADADLGCSAARSCRSQNDGPSWTKTQGGPGERYRPRFREFEHGVADRAVCREYRVLDAAIGQRLQLVQSGVAGARAGAGWGGWGDARSTGEGGRRSSPSSPCCTST